MPITSNHASDLSFFLEGKPGDPGGGRVPPTGQTLLGRILLSSECACRKLGSGIGRQAAILSTTRSPAASPQESPTSSSLAAPRKSSKGSLPATPRASGPWGLLPAP